MKRPPSVFLMTAPNSLMMASANVKVALCCYNKISRYLPKALRPSAFYLFALLSVYFSTTGRFPRVWRDLPASQRSPLRICGHLASPLVGLAAFPATRSRVLPAARFHLIYIKYVAASPSNWIKMSTFAVDCAHSAVRRRPPTVKGPIFCVL